MQGGRSDWDWAGVGDGGGPVPGLWAGGFGCDDRSGGP